MIDRVPDHLFVKDTRCRFVLANVAVSHDYGFPDPASLIGHTDSELHAPELAKKFMRDDLTVLRKGKPLIDIEEHVVRPDGSVRWLSTSKLPLRDADGRIIGLVGIARDITEQRQAWERNRFLAYHDALTGLPNRPKFELELAAAVASAAAGIPATLLLIDLDRFKYVNDTLGHVAGDDLLRQVGSRLSQLIGPAGMVARLGGDEFAVVLHGPAAEAADSMCQAILKQLQQPFRLLNDTTFVTASIGEAPWRAGTSADQLLREADIALYEAKANGRERWELFQASMAEALEERGRIERDLRTALERGKELKLEYQPIFAADSRTILGVEALLRWDHPERGRLSPERFVPVAEERGLIEPLGEWVVDEACRMLAATSVPWVAVNVSPVELRNRRFYDRVLDCLATRGIATHRLQIEITEGVLIDSSETVEEGLGRLRDAGIRLALDDFGTGYSSLNYLRRYNVDKLKVDRSFVAQLGESSDAEVIVGTIIELARAMQMRVTAEGVATERQRDILVEKGCDELQGFLLSRPLSLERLRELPGFAEYVKPER